MTTCNFEPDSYEEAVNSTDADKWKKAMKIEIDSLNKNNTYELVDLPDRKIIDTKWVYKIKKHADGTTYKYRARLVARGFTKVQGIDYIET